MDEEQEQDLDADQAAVIWWLVVFTLVFPTLHSLSQRAVQWLLKFLGALRMCLCKFSGKVPEIAKVFSSSL